MKLSGKDRRGREQQIVRNLWNDDSLQKRSRRRKHHSQGTHEVHQIDTPEYQAKIKKIYEMLKEGVRSNEIFTSMMLDEPNLGETRFVRMLKHAYEYGENQLHKDRDYVFQLHMQRYEDVYAKCRVMTDTWNRPLDPKKDWHIIVAKHMTALKALKSKENLLGLHDKSMVIELNEQKAVLVEKETITGKVGGYDIENLSLEEAKEMLDIIKAARTVPIEGIHRVVVKTTKIEINSQTGERNVNQEVINIDQTETQDIEFEEMPKEVVSKFKDITPPPEESNDIPSGPIVIDEVGEIEKPDAQDSVNKIHNAALESFRNKLREMKKK